MGMQVTIHWLNNKATTTRDVVWANQQNGHQSPTVIHDNYSLIITVHGQF